MKIRLVDDTPHIGGKDWDWIGHKGEVFIGKSTDYGIWITVVVKGLSYRLKLLPHEYEEVKK